MAERVAIVGGGAAGTLAAVHLLRAPRERGTVEIDLIDRDGSFGPGIAYGTDDPLHLVNVPAARMGAISGHADDFHRWLVARGEPVDEAAFPARSLYGAYLRDLLAAAERVAPNDRLRRYVGEVVGIAEIRDQASAVANRISALSALGARPQPPKARPVGRVQAMEEAAA